MCQDVPSSVFCDIFLNEIINCITLELNKLWYIPECKRMLNTNNPYFSLTLTPLPEVPVAIII